MKVIEQGNAQGPLPKWVGNMIKCSCGFKAKLEKGDGVKEHFERNETWYTIACPTCNKTISVA